MIADNSARMSEKTPLSPIFTVGGGKVAASIISLRFKKWIAAAGVILFLSVIASLQWGVEWLIVGLFVIFILIPNILGMSYIFYGMKPVTARNTVPHRIRLTPHTLVIEHFRKVSRAGKPEKETGKEELDYPDYKESGSKEKKLEEGKRKEEELKEEMLEKAGEEQIFYSELGEWIPGTDTISIPVGTKGSRGVIIIGKSAFSDESGFREFMDELRKRQTKGAR